MWTLEEGLALVRRLMPEAKRFRYDLSLGGGVLRNGQSQNDIDIICGPSNWQPDSDSALAEDFENFLVWLKSIPGLRFISQSPEGFGWNEISRAFRFEDEQGRKIDFFVHFHPGRVTRFSWQRWTNFYLGSTP